MHMQTHSFHIASTYFAVQVVTVAIPRYCEHATTKGWTTIVDREENLFQVFNIGENRFIPLHYQIVE